MRRHLSRAAARIFAFNRILIDMRTKAGGSELLFERRTEGGALKKAMSRGGVLLILVADQSARDNGLELPFFGRIPASRQHSAGGDGRALQLLLLYMPIYYRLGLGRRRIEVGAGLYNAGERRAVPPKPLPAT